MYNSNAYKEIVYELLSWQRDYAAEWIEQLKQSTKKIYIFGAGAAGKNILATLHENGIRVSAFIDNSPAKLGTEIDGIPIVSIGAYCSDSCSKIIVLGTVAYHDEIVDQCMETGILMHEICFADFLHYSSENTTRNYILSHIDSVVNVFSHCADEESRRLFLSSLIYQLNRDRRIYKETSSPLLNQYYEPEIISLSENEVYIDCGAKDGDTALGFHRFSNGKYKKIIAFEPDNDNYEILLKSLKHYSLIESINAGVGEKAMQLAFDGCKGGHSAFKADGTAIARIVPLDDYYEEKPTFIKMDIEGFELDALKGAEKTLQNLKPKLAICVYHKPQDVLELPDYILRQRDDYRVYFRVYRRFFHDMVCYCV